jgi:hypothetical protein
VIGALRALRRFVIATSGGPLRPIWAAVYGAAALAAAAWLRRGLPVGVYLRGGLARGEAEYGLSDIDLSVITPDSRHTQEMRRRALRLREILTPLGQPVECHHVEARDAVELACLAPVFTHGLHGHDGKTESIRMQERPVREGQLSNWRLLSGPDLRPLARSGWPQRDRPAVAWLDLQFWWRHAFELGAENHHPWFAASCVKLVAEPIRTALWLEDGTEFGSRREALEHARRYLPHQSAAIDHAVELQRGARHGASSDLRLVLSALVEVTLGVAAEIGRRAEAAGVTPVALEGLEHTCPLPARKRSAMTALAADPGRPLPLVDWRARTLGPSPDPVLVPVEGDPADPARLAEVSSASATGLYPALGIGSELMVLPTAEGAAARLRGVECPATDPVSFALLAGQGDAHFAELPGWSAADTSRRAVRAHALRLGRDPDQLHRERPGEKVARLFASARAALFFESVEAGEPTLLLTMEAVAEALAGMRAGDRTAVEEALGFYKAGREQGRPTPGGVLEALRPVVTSLPAYASDARPVAS